MTTARKIWLGGQILIFPQTYTKINPLPGIWTGGGVAE